MANRGSISQPQHSSFPAEGQFSLMILLLFWFWVYFLVISVDLWVFNHFANFQGMEQRMGCMKNYGGLVQVLWWMFLRLEKEFTISHKATWNKWVLFLFCNFSPYNLGEFGINVQIFEWKVEYFFISLFFSMWFIFYFVWCLKSSCFWYLLVGSIYKSGIRSEDTDVQFAFKDPLQCSSHSATGMLHPSCLWFCVW